MARYKMVEELGRGGMGVVYRATHVDLGRDIALKLLPPDGEVKADTLARFHREVKLCSELSHPNIIKIYDSGEMDGRPFYTMEIVQGTDLHAVMKVGPQPVDLVVELMTQAADALAYIHEKGLFHRDIKPANIMLSGSGVITIMDFGLAKAPASTVLTQEGSLVGTPRYLAPEAIRGKDAAPPADVYALALTTHELLAGKSWSDVKGLKELAIEIVKGDVPDLSTIRPDVPRWLLDLQRWALDKDPAKRATAAQYRDGFKNKRGTPVAASGSGVTKRMTRPVPVASRMTAKTEIIPPPSNKGKVIAAAGAAALVAVGVLAALVPRSAPVGEGPSPVASRPAPVLRFEPPSLPAHRRVAARLTGRVAPGARGFLIAQDRSVIASAPVSPDGDVTFVDAPPESDLTVALRGADGVDLVPAAAVKTPKITPVIELMIWPQEDEVTVGFELHEAHGCTIEVGPWATRATQVRGERKKPSKVHDHRFRGLKPETEYFVRVTLDTGWGGCGDVRFVTKERAYGDAVQRHIKHALSQPETVDMTAEYFQSVPDWRGEQFFVELLAKPDHSLSAVYKVGWLMYELRSRKLFDALLPLENTKQVSPHLFRGALMRTASYLEHPAARALAERSIGARQHTETLESARIFGREGGRDNCDLIARTLEKDPAYPELAIRMALADAPRAREHFARWVDSDPGLALSAVDGLEFLATDADVSMLVKIVNGKGASGRARAIEALSVIYTPAARKALLEAFRAKPDEEARVWAVARAGLAEVAPELEKLGAAAKTPELKNAYAEALRLVKVPAQPLGAEPRVYKVSPRAPFQRTGIYLEAGDSIEVSAAGQWGFTGKPLKHVQLKQPFVDGDERGAGLQFWAMAGQGVHRIEKKPNRLIAQRRGELLLCPYSPWWSLWHKAPLLQVEGEAQVTVKR